MNKTSEEMMVLFLIV